MKICVWVCDIAFRQRCVARWALFCVTPRKKGDFFKTGTLSFDNRSCYVVASTSFRADDAFSGSMLF